MIARDNRSGGLHQVLLPEEHLVDLGASSGQIPTSLGRLRAATFQSASERPAADQPINYSYCVCRLLPLTLWRLARKAELREP
jgi:hypothetical protein